MKKKSLIALAALAVAGVASAQSSVTLFGVIDAAISGYKVQSDLPLGGTVNISQTALTNSGYNSSRLGLRGSEDLGGGLAASFWLEAGIANDTGSGAAPGGGLNFNRRSTVSLSGAFGEVRLGRDYSPTYWNDTVFDPLNSNGVGGSLIGVASGGSSFGVPNSGFQSNPNYVRASNSVGYFLPPNLGGFYGQVMYAFNEATTYSPGGATPPGIAAIVARPALATVADNARAGRYIGARGGYLKGPLDVALAYGESTIASNYYLGSTTTLDTWNLGASYDFGPVKLFGEYSNNKQKTDLATNTFNPFGTTKPGANGVVLGATVPIGPGLIRASWSAVKYNNTNTLNLLGLREDPKADQLAISYGYNLSKRTALYASFAYLSDKDGAALAVNGSPLPFTGLIPGAGIATPSKSMGYNLGLRHVF